MPIAMRAARAGFRLVGPVAPSLASGYAERLFLTARRHKRPLWEQQALATAAERFAIPHDGKLLPAWRWGEGPTVLLVHGWEGRGSQMAAFVEPLVERGFSVVTFDVQGHGDAPDGFSSVVEHARSIASAGAYVTRLWGPVHAIVAHSVGGPASLFAIRLGLRFGRLALIAPPNTPARFAAGFGKMLGLGPDVLSGMIARIERRYGLAMSDLVATADAAKLTAPLLVVHDADDRVVPIEDGMAIANAAPGSRLVTTKGLGHSRVLRAPEVLATVIPFVTDGASTATLADTIAAELFDRERRW